MFQNPGMFHQGRLRTRIDPIGLRKPVSLKRRQAYFTNSQRAIATLTHPDTGALRTISGATFLRGLEPNPRINTRRRLRSVCTCCGVSYQKCVAINCGVDGVVPITETRMTASMFFVIQLLGACATSWEKSSGLNKRLAAPSVPKV